MNDQDVDRVEAYLDDTLSDDERRDIEHRFESEPELSAMIQQQKLLDESLTRMFSPPSEKRANDLLTAAIARARSDAQGQSADPTRLAAEPAGRQTQPDAMKKSSHDIFKFIRPLAVAACIVMLGVAGRGIWESLQEEEYEPPDGETFVSDYGGSLLDIAYNQMVATGFSPLWVCETDAEFANTFADRLGQPMLLGQLPTGAVATGLSYIHSISPDTIALLGRFEGEPVTVFVDRLSWDPEQVISRNPGELQMFRRQIGDIVLYEITPLNEPKFLNSFYLVNPENK